MQHKLIVFFSVTLLILLGCGSKQAAAINATVTHTLFRTRTAQDSNQYRPELQLCWRADARTLHFSKNKAGNVAAEIIVMIRLSTDTGIAKEETFVIHTPPKSSTGEALTQHIADLYRYPLQPGSYQLELVLLEQAYKDQLFQYSDTFSVPPPARLPRLSGLYLLDTFFQATPTPNVYNRQNRLLLPLYSNYLDDKHRTLLCYAEVYPGDSVRDLHFPLLLNTYISWKASGNLIPGLGRTDTIPANHFHSGCYTLPVDGLASGNYYLNMVLSDSRNMVLHQQQTFFQRYNPNPTPAQKDTAGDKPKTVKTDSSGNEPHVLDLTNTFLGKYSAAQVREVLKMIALICEKEESAAIQGFLKKPDELYSKYFIYNFWEKRDKLHPEKAWKAYTERIKEVNRLFGGGGKPGYETDRGRVYIQYGKPNDRIQVPNELGALPYEIWQYYTTEKTRRETVFLFYKPGSSVGGFELLHTTVVGEKRNMNWRSLLYSNGITGSGISRDDSQAEQYIGNK